MKKLMIAAVAGCLVATSCTQVAGWFGGNSDSTNTLSDSSMHAAYSRDESITEANAYSDLFLDSASLEQYISKEKIADSSAHALRNFYRVRNYQYAWFTTQGITEQGMGLWNLYSADSVRQEKELKQRMDSLVQDDSLTITKGDSSYLSTELALTKNLVQYAGRSDHDLITAQNIYYLVPAKRMDPMIWADSLLRRSDSSQYSSNKAWTAMRQQLSLYYQAAQDSSWTALPAGSNWKKGSSSPQITALKKRLQLMGDYTGDTSARFNDTLEMAIRDVQKRYGLAVNGRVNDSLVNMLNISPKERVQQILVNMNRMLWMPAQQDSSVVMVNIPSYMLYVQQGDSQVLEMPVAVGKEGANTLMFTGELNQVVFCPYWRIPRSIVESEILPKMKADKNYLTKHHMEIVKQNNSIPEIRQLPGKDNAMGQVKFLFPNSYEIFLHDTPDKSIFRQKDRAISHGCIRVADAAVLAQFLLKDQPEWNDAKIRSAMNSGKEQTVSVKQARPVAITYYTAWIGADGKMNFRNDVYGHDKETGQRLFNQS